MLARKANFPSFASYIGFLLDRVRINDQGEIIILEGDYDEDN